MRRNFFFFFVFMLNALKIYSGIPGYLNVYNGVGVGVDNFTQDLFFYERLRYQFFSGLGVNVSQNFAFGGEFNLDIKFLPSYTPYTKDIMFMLDDRSYLKHSLSYFIVKDVSISMRMYGNYFFLPYTPMFSLIFFTGLKFSYIDAKIRFRGSNDWALLNNVVLGVDIGARINIDFIFLEYTISPIFYNKLLLLNQMHKITLGFIFQFDVATKNDSEILSIL
ncbi:hypothetical protein [Borreliella valaisiana]|uniref:Uncharacterized protein n=1 Tax=Borreliella valaisiana VS116 TaxID=445987 RepID=D6RXL7_BORVA|nr:hypothetical protein [Borreliella valaisiana]AIJ29741.1 hypothetical protein P613_01895 [Borreliella valaisiana Tom4006]EEF81605.1 conserved hypothetical protein [Borreliella valaisiana VS116]WKC77018.1 hypothetical protein QIA32_02395 [Borreliella valaisiana]WLN25180.1 hypothetical protein KJD10_01850 [Borreliella valaisiana]WVN14106.1 hypothetical protein KJD09_01875 [Borreliella valaisiana]